MTDRSPNEAPMLDPAGAATAPPGLPRVAVLIVASEHHPAYAAFRRVWRTYMGLLEPEVRCWFLDMDPAATVEVREDAARRAIVVKGSEAQRLDGVPSILHKTLVALRYLVRERSETFDFVVRTNLSSFLMLDRLLEHLRGLPRSQIVQGVRGIHDGLPFTSGALTLWSMDAVAHLLAEHRAGHLDASVPDDVALGACLAQRFPLSDAPRVMVEQHPFDPASIDERAFHVRVKSADRFEDAGLHVALLERFYGARLARPSSERSLALVTAYLAPPSQGPLIRDAGWYARHAAQLFASTSLPILAYVEEAHVKRFRALIPAGAPVRVEPVAWGDLPALAWVERIRENRVRDGTLLSRGRNTPEHFALLASKWHFVERALDADPFAASHLGWIDVGITHVTGPDAPRHLGGDVRRTFPDRIRLGQVHLRPTAQLRDLAAWYGPTRGMACALAGGLFTGRADMLRLVAAAFDVAFIETVSHGYGHGDEAVLSTVYGRHPEWFDPYLGDYAGLLENYARLTRDLTCVLLFTVKEARAQGDFDAARRACLQIHDALARGASFDDPRHLAVLYHEWLVAAWHAEDGRYRSSESLECLLRLETQGLRPLRLPGWEPDLELVRAIADVSSRDGA